METTDIALLSTFQKHIEDMRNLSLCKICIKPFYEPFILPCGHTYCYSCLASWFGGSHSRKRKKNCPDCRAEVKVQPSPNYLLRDLVHMFISRAELLPEDETVQEHQQAKEDEAVMLAADRTGVGLFKGAFAQPRHRTIVSWGGQGVMDYEDGVVRCPECHWELEDGQCLQCGFLQYEPGDSESNSGEESTINSEDLQSTDTDFDGDADEIDQDFGHSLEIRYYDSNEEYGTSSDGSHTDQSQYYDERYDLDGFLDNGDTDGEESDANSESTMTLYHRQQRPSSGNGPFGPIRASDSEGSDSEGSGRSPVYMTFAALQRRPHFANSGTQPNDRSDAQSTAHEETSDAHTNYDEETEASEAENTHIRTRTRPRRIVVSDDSEEDAEASSGSDSASEEESDISGGGTDDRVTDPSLASHDEVDDDALGSEDSDIRPPQPSAVRRQRLQGQRARRNNHSYHAHTRARGVQSNHAQERQRIPQTDGRPRNSASEYMNVDRAANHRPTPHRRPGQ